MGVIDGTPVDAATTNPAFLDANADDVAQGIIGFQNIDPSSGPFVNNIQAESNSVASFIGKVLNNAFSFIPTFTNTQGFTAQQDLLSRIEALSAKFHSTTGHKHDATAGNGAPINASAIANVPLKGFVIQGPTLTGVTGSSVDVTTQFAGLTASPGDLTPGVVVLSPYNKTLIRQATGAKADDVFTDANGNIVFARLAFDGSSWSLGFFVDISGTETAYSFASSTSLKFYFQQLFNPLSAGSPVYSQFAVIPSENATADVINADEFRYGKVIFNDVISQPIASASTKGGSVTQKVAYSDHTHEGAHSVGIYQNPGSSLVGDVVFESGTGLTFTYNAGRIKVDSSGATVGYQYIPSNAVNGTNPTFGPIPRTLANNESVIPFVDGLAVSNDKWSVVSNSVVFNVGNIPQTGQQVHFFYLADGVLPPAPVVSGATNTEFRTITSAEASAKVIVLAHAPGNPAEALVDLIGGSPQEFGSDYTILGAEFRWSGYALDGVLAAGDRLRFHYVY